MKKLSVILLFSLLFVGCTESSLRRARINVVRSTFPNCRIFYIANDWDQFYVVDSTGQIFAVDTRVENIFDSSSVKICSVEKGIEIY